MSLAVIHSRALHGLASAEVTVEVHLANGLPSFTLVGLVDVEVKEARERVRAAITNAGLEFPHNKRITVNLAPADLPKVGRANEVPNRTTKCQIRSACQDGANNEVSNGVLLPMRCDAMRCGAVRCGVSRE